MRNMACNFECCSLKDSFLFTDRRKNRWILMSKATTVSPSLLHKHYKGVQLHPNLTSVKCTPWGRPRGSTLREMERGQFMSSRWVGHCTQVASHTRLNCRQNAIFSSLSETQRIEMWCIIVDSDFHKYCHRFIILHTAWIDVLYGIRYIEVTRAVIPSGVGLSASDT